MCMEKFGDNSVIRAHERTHTAEQGWCWCDDLQANPRWEKHPDPEVRTRILLPNKECLGEWESVAKDDKVTFLITGETGTGKESLPDLIHAKSSMKGRPLGHANCAGLSGNLFQSEVFGHVKGSFTGAYKDRKGILREHKGSSVVLDEIGESENNDQVKLLRFLQSGEVQPVGTDSTEYVKVRIIATTNADPVHRLRPDLRARFLYRIVLPPLRSRDLADICSLLGEFLRKSKVFTGVSLTWLMRLLSYGWPANIRELNNYCSVAESIVSGRAGSQGNHVLDESVRTTNGPWSVEALEDKSYQRDTNKVTDLAWKLLATYDAPDYASRIRQCAFENKNDIQRKLDELTEDDGNDIDLSIGGADDISSDASTETVPPTAAQAGDGDPQSGSRSARPAPSVTQANTLRLLSLLADEAGQSSGRYYHPKDLSIELLDEPDNLPKCYEMRLGEGTSRMANIIRLLLDLVRISRLEPDGIDKACLKTFGLATAGAQHRPSDERLKEISMLSASLPKYETPTAKRESGLGDASVAKPANQAGPRKPGRPPVMEKVRETLETAASRDWSELTLKGHLPKHYQSFATLKVVLDSEKKAGDPGSKLSPKAQEYVTRLVASAAQGSS